MGKTINTYDLYYNNVINIEPMDLNRSDRNLIEVNDEKVKYIYTTPWFESPLFWLIFSLNSANLFGFQSFENYKSEGVLIIIYLSLLITVGLPLLLIETLVSQFSRKPSIELWESLPLIGKGLAFTQCIITIIQSIVYTFFTATVLRILFNVIQSLITSKEQPILPWIENNDNCTNFEDHNSFNKSLQTFTLNESSFECKCMYNVSESCFKHPLSEMYLLTDIWQLTNFQNTINGWNIESFCWKFSAFMIAIQVFIFLTTLRSVERITRYISVLIITFSVLVFLALLIMISCQKEFSAEKYFKAIIDNGFEGIQDFKNWLRMLSHVVTSLYLAIGFVPHFGHRIDFKYKKTYRNNIIAVISNLLAFILLRFLSSILVFYNRTFQSKSVQFVEYEIVLPFSIYVIICDALTFLTNNFNPTIIISLTIAFLLAVVLIGLHSIALLRETTIGFFINREEDKPYQNLIVKIIVTFLLLSSVLLATNRGSAFIMILYTYGIVTPVIVCILLQLIILLWLYGIERFQSDIHFMIDSVIPLPIRLLWTFFTPIILVGIYVTFLIQTKFWTNIKLDCISITKIILISIIVIPIPVSVIIRLRRAPAYSLKERFKHIMNTESDWGPTIPFYRRLWLYRNSNKTSSGNSLQLIEAKRHTFDTNRKSIIDQNLTSTNNFEL